MFGKISGVKGELHKNYTKPRCALETETALLFVEFGRKAGRSGQAGKQEMLGWQEQERQLRSVRLPHLGGGPKILPFRACLLTVNVVYLNMGPKVITGLLWNGRWRFAGTARKCRCAGDRNLEMSRRVRWDCPEHGRMGTAGVCTTEKGTAPGTWHIRERSLL